MRPWSARAPSSRDDLAASAGHTITSPLSVSTSTRILRDRAAAELWSDGIIDRAEGGSSWSGAGRPLAEWCPSDLVDWKKLTSSGTARRPHHCSDRERSSLSMVPVAVDPASPAFRYNPWRLPVRGFMRRDTAEAGTRCSVDSTLSQASQSVSSVKPIRRVPDILGCL